MELTNMISENLLVGRDSELDQLQGYLNKAKAGAGSFMLITGEDGIGKSALARRFLKLSEEGGATCVSVSYAPRHAYAPYAPWQEVLRCLNTPTSSTAEPESNTSSASEPATETESLHLLQANQGLTQQTLLRQLLQAAERRTLVIFIEDIHLAPATAWKFMHYLSEGASECGVLILATLRQEDRQVKGSRIPVYADVLSRMNRDGLITEIRLKQLSEIELRELVRQMFPRRDFSVRFVPILLELTAGNPGLAVQCLKSMMRLGLIFQQEGVWFDQENLDRENLMSLTSDETKLKIIAEQVEKLSPVQRRLLSYVALMQMPATPGVLASVAGLPAVQVIKDLDFLKREKLLIQIDEDRYHLKHNGIRPALLEHFSADQLPSLHESIAAALEAVPLDETERTYQLAYHYQRSANRLLAFRNLRRAGLLALKNYAFIEAKSFLDDATKLNHELECDTCSVELVGLHVLAAWLDRVLGNWHDSLQHCQTALALCASQHDPKKASQILLQQGLTYFRLNQWQNAERCFRQCLDQTEVKFECATAQLGLGNVNFELGNYDGARQHYEQAVKLAETIGNKQLLANAFNSLGAVESASGNRLKAIALYSRSIPMFRNLNDSFGLARVYHNIGMTYADEENWEEANKFYGQSLRVSDTLGLVPLKSITFLNRAYCLAHLKQFNDAREYNFKAHRLLKRLKDELGLAEYYKVQGIIERESGDYEAARSQLDLAIKKFSEKGSKLGQAETQYELAQLAAIDGNSEEAHWLQQALQSYRELGIKSKVKLVEEQLQSHQPFQRKEGTFA
jgi:predicted ATPase